MKTGVRVAGVPGVRDLPALRAAGDHHRHLLLIAFREVGLERSLVTVTIGHVVLVLAIVYRMVMIRLESLEDSQIEASLDLGANGWQTFLHVVLPQLRSALVTSGLLAFTLSFDETLVTFFLVGGDATLPIRLWAHDAGGFHPEVNALVSIVLVVQSRLPFSARCRLRRRWHDDDR